MKQALSSQNHFIIQVLPTHAYSHRSVVLHSSSTRSDKQISRLPDLQPSANDKDFCEFGWKSVCVFVWRCQTFDPLLFSLSLGGSQKGRRIWMPLANGWGLPGPLSSSCWVLPLTLQWGCYSFGRRGKKCWKSAVQAELEEWGSHGQGLINEPLI